MSNRFVAFSFLFIAVAGFSVPMAGAVFLPDHQFSTAIQSVDFNDPSIDLSNPTDLFTQIALLTGKTEISGTSRGIFGFLSTSRFDVTKLIRVEAYNITEIQKSLKERRLPEGDFANFFTGATVTADDGSNILVVADDFGLTFECGVPFGISMSVELPETTFENQTKFPLDTSSFLITGADAQCTLGYQRSTNASFMLMADDDSAVTVREAGGDTMRFEGTDWVFRLAGPGEYEVTSLGILTPFHDGTVAKLKAYGKDDIGARFTLAPFQAVVELIAGQAGTPIDEDEPFLDAVKDALPLLDGVLIGNLSSTTFVGGVPFQDSAWGLIRYESVEVRPGDAEGQALITGKSRLLIVGGDFYTVREHAKAGALWVPLISIFLWVVAVGAIVAGFVLKPFVGAEQVKSFGLVRLLGLVFHLLALVASFILWDVEINGIFGTSLITLFRQGAQGQSTMLATISFLQLVPYTLAMFMFGYPMRFITNVALKLGGLKRARGFGKGVGNLATWGLGALYYRVLIGGFLALLLDLAGSFIPGG